MKNKDTMLEVKSENMEELAYSLLQNFDAKELGVFISLLSQLYIENHDITKDEFMKSLSKSLDMLAK